MTWRQNLILVFVGTYSAIWTNLGAFAVGALPATAAFALMFWGFSSGMEAMLIAAPFMFVVGHFLTVMVVNALHRQMLLPAEQHTSLLHVMPRTRDWKAFGAIILMTLAARLPTGLIDRFSETAQPIALIILHLAWWIAYIVLVPRLVLVFPAIATDQPQALKTAWRLSKGTAFYFWPVCISIAAIAVVLFGGAGALTGALGWVLPAPFPNTVQGLCFGFLLVLMYGLLASLAAQLYAMKQPPQKSGVEEVFE